MIPKMVHYCWFGRNQLPPLAIKCIESWKKYLPDYEIIEWNEENYDVNMIPYTAEAYKLKKYAFVSDYARFWILYNYGGIYFDTDVELIRNIDDIIENGAFIGIEKHVEGAMDSSFAIKKIGNKGVNPGLGMGGPIHYRFFNEMIESYKKSHITDWIGRLQPTVVWRASKYLNSKDLKKQDNNIFVTEDGLFIYPDDYFCPLNYYTNELIISTNTRSIHHYHASWVKKDIKLIDKLKKHVALVYVRLFCGLIY